MFKPCASELLSYGLKSWVKVTPVVASSYSAGPALLVVLVLDATVGQNALSQVEIFGRVAGVTGLVMTKLDGTARGGILVAIADKFKLPVHFIGVGETVDDLEPFAARDFARAAAMKSPSVLNGESAPVARMKSKKPRLETGAKSRSGSNGSFSNSETLTAVPLVRSASV